MAVIDTEKRASGNGTGEFMVLPTDVYRMRIMKADIEEDQYAETRKDGTKPEKLVIVWEVSELLPEQDDEAIIGQKVWQRFNPYYGPVKDGVSKFKAFIDLLRSQGHLPNFSPKTFDTDHLVNIEQRVSVEQYIKGQGPNAGSPGNKVVSVLPLRPQRKKPEVVSKPLDEPLPADSEDGAIPF